MRIAKHLFVLPVLVFALSFAAPRLVPQASAQASPADECMDMLGRNRALCYLQLQPGSRLSPDSGSVSDDVQISLDRRYQQWLEFYCRTFPSDAITGICSTPVSSWNADDYADYRRNIQGWFDEMMRAVERVRTGTGSIDSGFSTGASLLPDAGSRPLDSLDSIAFESMLEGRQVVPPVITAARGSGKFHWTEDGLRYSILVEDLSGPVFGAHFHSGREGEPGPVEEAILFLGNRAQGVWRDMTAQQKADLNAGNIHVKVHTVLNPDGEIRGQLVPASGSGDVLPGMPAAGTDTVENPFGIDPAQRRERLLRDWEECADRVGRGQARCAREQLEQRREDRL